MKKTLIDAGMQTDLIRLDVERGYGNWHPVWRKGFKKGYPWLYFGE